MNTCECRGCYSRATHVVAGPGEVMRVCGHDIAWAIDETGLTTVTVIKMEG
jgi:hypothetical protein